MATKKNTAVGQTAPTPASAPATGSITLPEMPPAESFVGLVAYGVDTTTDESKHIPLEFLASGVQACIDATADAITKTAAAVAATEKADTATTGADDAAELARGEAENLSALKEAVANATADAVAKTVAAETATGAANTATTNANNATSDAIAKTEAAQTATNEAIAAKDAAIEATENLTSDVSALVLTDANKPRIQELAGFDYSILAEQIVPGEFWIGTNGVRRQVYTRTFRGANSPTSFPKSTFDKYGYAWTFYQIGKINNCRLLYANVGEHDVNDTVTGGPNYIHKGLELWFKESVNTKFNNVPYVLTFKYTKP